MSKIAYSHPPEGQACEPGREVMIAGATRTQGDRHVFQFVAVPTLAGRDGVIPPPRHTPDEHDRCLCGSVEWGPEPVYLRSGGSPTR